MRMIHGSALDHAADETLLFVLQVVMETPPARVAIDPVILHNYY